MSHHECSNCGVQPCDCGADDEWDCEYCQECLLELYDTELEYEEEQDG